jgi:hypothetical protein
VDSLTEVLASRLEGDSDPDEEVVVYALRCPRCECKGTFTTVFGPNVPQDDLDVELALRDARRR